MDIKKGKTEKFHIAEISFLEWESLWAKSSKANLLQSWQYGAAKEQTSGWRACRFVVSDDIGQPVALAQWLVLTWPFVGGIARLNRGPQLLDSYSDEEGMRVGLEILKKLLDEARKKCWWVVQIAPELQHSDYLRGELKGLGFHSTDPVAWASGLIDLNKEDSTLLMQLDGKWRNCMRKGERLGVIVKKEAATGNNLDFLIASYTGLQDARKFEGLSEPLIRNLSAQSGEKWSFDLFVAFNSSNLTNKEPIGQLVTIRHGDTASYLIGITNHEGRQMQANSVLLWHSIIYAKCTGCSWFDIGGLNARTTKGIAEFKKGLNATSYELVGEWRGYLFPWQRFYRTHTTVL